MQWQELAMLLGNDAAEGREVKQSSEADRVFLLLKGRMRRLREQLRITPNEQPHVEHVVVAPEFQADLAAVWQRYLALQVELAADRFEEAQAAIASLDAAVATVDDAPLSEHVKGLWSDEKEKLSQVVDNLKLATDVETMRVEFKPLSETIGTLAKSFGFGEAGPIYELHCPMAFQGQGAVWYQASDQVRNPYYGASMLTCADRVEELRVESRELRDEE
jgi:Cu(I)/Ag(I) efflux system membrane fusion protein